MQNQYYQGTSKQFPIAMAYVPFQKSPKLYENLEEGFKKGTAFPELDKPFVGKRGKR